ncbi:hydrogenase formation protein HypD [Synechococcus sp. J7-Johnson]|uniref:hydrogenase formation protein HypD n=1 Tax=Synechococcus sp. J7-Johnson TaxID=2823737 RepID=UPI0020CDB930|nr:hydrogenase formation protein HypD [Synechococcus sp. J7-Johnson]MCP9840751.1 hydrogenase formation protein HypD [Synechococcus sp. J7-Johnson]
MTSTVNGLATRLAAITTRPWTLMEVCGGQTHAIVRWGLDQLLPPGLRLIHGPGCPVCVTPAATIDAALQLARRPEVILCSYGDMLRVPGSSSDDLLGVRAAGGDVRLLTSPLQALELARRHPQRTVVFLAVGFETTAPATALLARQALGSGVRNLLLLTAHVRVPPAMEAILSADGNQVQGFLAAGHVCTVMGTGELNELVQRHRVPVVVTGFEPIDLMRGLLRCVELLEAGQPQLANAYPRVVKPEGNPAARALLEEVFAVVDQPWRGFGMIPGGGLALREAYASLDVRRHVSLGGGTAGDPGNPCISGLILQGRRSPRDCPAFGTSCTPEHPLGAPMVSSEGACAAYHLYRRHD